MQTCTKVSGLSGRKMLVSDGRSFKLMLNTDPEAEVNRQHFLLHFYCQYSEVSPLNYGSYNVPVPGYGGLGSTVRTQPDTTHQFNEA